MSADLFAGAACKGKPTEWWYPEMSKHGEPVSGTAKEQAARALAICATCPVRQECLDAGIDDDWAILGGTTPRERRKLRGRRPSLPPRRCDNPACPMPGGIFKPARKDRKCCSRLCARAVQWSSFWAGYERRPSICRRSRQESLDRLYSAAVPIALVIEATVRACDVSESWLRSQDQGTRVRAARLALYGAAHRLGFTFSAIALELDRDPSTVRYGVLRAESRPELAETVERILSTVEAPQEALVAS